MGRHGKCFNAAFYTTLLIILILQLLSTLERQVFDFLGFMWAPIIANFFQLVCVIIGGFGAYQYRSKFIAVYSTWSLIWLGWNVFVICLYLEVGVLNRKRDLYILSIGTKNKSWWLENGIGCQITNTSWKLTNTVQDSSRDIPPEDVIKGCLLEYYYVEVIHAAVQCLLALIGFVFSCITLYMYGDEEESSSPANDELEFVKMYKAPSRSSGVDNGGRSQASYCDNQTFNGVANEYPTIERPPSYETSMRDGTVINNYYSTDRQSVRSLRSVRSKGSTKSKSNRTREDARPKNLPWVQITPSSSSMDAPFRHYP
ncbi:sodium/potassium-transporting ATPase subunit beta-1-interacting protein 3-like isoform X4 [Mizuhopecten yessoensis]|uniref:Sodium/potassium-transporting ATPase subunit beta-1-interacting protein n=1 Tax=Mizuhopecten yessoensis TaxID=6573 RepID=A0A210QEX8_MIZYE|nr:sodium/potassium-transporting ATPase subunit beta-1-interacting protein 3-like isoform X4 [Mizuhopecten yessoensis]OWF47306.1 Sodium/potassium-transporting ATPase subunit beta-1-interacting protein 3 [Mizuhopecten yessoensis]